MLSHSTYAGALFHFAFIIVPFLVLGISEEALRYVWYFTFCSSFVPLANNKVNRMYSALISDAYFSVKTLPCIGVSR